MNTAACGHREWRATREAAVRENYERDASAPPDCCRSKSLRTPTGGDPATPTTAGDPRPGPGRTTASPDAPAWIRLRRNVSLAACVRAGRHKIRSIEIAAPGSAEAGRNSPATGRRPPVRPGGLHDCRVVVDRPALQWRAGAGGAQCTVVRASAEKLRFAPSSVVVCGAYGPAVAASASLSRAASPGSWHRSSRSWRGDEQDVQVVDWVPPDLMGAFCSAGARDPTHRNGHHSTS
jgi:hypothetical protein